VGHQLWNNRIRVPGEIELFNAADTEIDEGYVSEEPFETAQEKDVERNLVPDNIKPEPSGEAKEVESLLEAARMSIEDAAISGKNVKKVEEIYDKAEYAFEAGNLSEARDLTLQARELAISAPSIQDVPPLFDKEAIQEAEAIPMPVEERAIYEPVKPGKAITPGIYVVEKGDNLWNIAKRVGGRGAGWVKIWRANEEKIKDFDRIYPNQEIIIP